MNRMLQMVTGTKLNLTVALTVLLLFGVAPHFAVPSDILPPRFIAHAGGALKDQTYTNSLEALNANYLKGFRFFEVDFSWTVDKELVAIHDWKDAFRGKFVILEDIDVPTKAQFLKLKMKSGLTQLSLEDVLRWARKKGDAYIITDVKEKNTNALRTIYNDFGEYQGHVIPQVYSFQEYDEVRKLGYRNIILTLYRMKINPYEVIDFVYSNAPFAVTMPWEIAQSGLAYYLQKNRTVVYAHTVNDFNLFNELRKVGVFGVYTDILSPP